MDVEHSAAAAAVCTLKSVCLLKEGQKDHIAISECTLNDLIYK